MSDALMCGRRFRTFNVVDDFNREALAIEIDLSLPAPRVIRVLERVSLFRGYPEKLRVDNGPEFISLALAECSTSSNQENQHRTRTLNASIEPIEMSCLICTCSERSEKSGR
jgi:transposase InsO family protein